jgi:RNA polymerase II subunit A-like phosphatase
MVVAIDDRADVWHWSPNLIKVRPYNFFLGIGDINEPMKEDDSLATSNNGDLSKDKNALKQSTAPIVSMTLLQPEKIEPSSRSNIKTKPRPVLSDDDGDLIYLSKALSTLHEEYFKIYTTGTSKADVTNILPSLKLNVLGGVHLVFSGVIPLGTDPTLQDIWILATQFGAKCYMEITSSTTHLIARKVNK